MREVEVSFTIQLLRSYIELKVIVACVIVVFPDDEELSCFPETVEGEGDALFFRILKSINSEIRPGLDIFWSSTFIAPVSIFIILDMDGLSFGTSWVQRRPTFKYLQASSILKSSSNEVSTNATSSPFSYNFHAYRRVHTIHSNRLRKAKKKKSRKGLCSLVNEQTPPFEGVIVEILYGHLTHIPC